MRNFKSKFLLLCQSTPFILCVLMIFMFLDRVIPVYHMVFTDWSWWHGNYVNFASDDAVYHMRLVHNTLKHFPFRIFFDPFTHFPYGNQIHFGPLFTFLLATPAWILGFGHPSDALINAVGAFVPPILGALCIIPTYYVGKNIFNRTAGLLAATTLACLPGEFFARSSLGFTDHHVAEVFFSTWIFAFVSLFFRKYRDIHKSNLADYAKTNLSTQSDSFILLKSAVFGAGIAFGLYLLAWPAAFLVSGIFLLFFIEEFSFPDKNYHNSENLLLLLAATLYLIPVLMGLPYFLQNLRFQVTYYSLAQPILLILHFLLVLILYFIFKFCKKKNLPIWAFPILLITVFFIAFLTLNLFVPSFYNSIIFGICMLFKPAKGMLTVAEVWPIILDRNNGNISFSTIWYNFFGVFPLSFIALCWLLTNKIQKVNKSNHYLLVIWSIVMLAATLVQQRFAYYFAINAALLTGYLGDRFFRYMYLHYLNTHERNSDLKFWSGLACCGLFCLIIIYPILPFSYVKTHGYGPRISKTWYDVYFWLHKNTPGLNNKQSNLSYEKGFYIIPKKIGSKYLYPKDAYGVMSWWHLGHQLTYIAERMPVTNPFQQGIVENTNSKLGAAPFFTATDESAAIYNLKMLRTRYVLIDNSIASTQYLAMLIWEGENQISWQNSFLLSKKLTPKTIKIFFDAAKFKNSLLYRLYYLDGNKLQHLRLVSEFGSDYLINAKIIDVNTGKRNPYYIIKKDNYAKALQFAKAAQQLIWLDKKHNKILYDVKPPVKEIKIFERVRGATILGKAPNGVVVNLYLKLLVKSPKIQNEQTSIVKNLNFKKPISLTDGRTIIYTQTTIARNGIYKFIVPYPTSHMVGKGYDYPVEPCGTYLLRFGKHVKRIAITEEEIQGGALKSLFEK